MIVVGGCTDNCKGSADVHDTFEYLNDPDGDWTFVEDSDLPMSRSSCMVDILSSSKSI